MGMYGASIAFGLVAGINPCFQLLWKDPAKYFRNWIIAAIAWFFISLGYFYFIDQRAFVGPFFGCGWEVLIAWIISCVFYSLLGEEPIVGSVLTAIAGVVLLYCIWESQPGPRADLERSMIGAFETKVWTHGSSSPTSGTHFRMFSREHAIEQMKSVMARTVKIGNDDVVLGSMFELDTDSLTIQKLRDNLVWVCPLKFRNYWIWRKVPAIPVYVRIDAQDPKAQAELCPQQGGLRMRFMPSAAWNFNLSRHMWKAYPGYSLVDYRFETDDNDRAYWIVTLTSPTSMYAGEAIRGVLVIDPETGKIDKYTNNAPAWIDRIVPGDLALQRVERYGMFQNGWINVGGGNQLKPVGGPIEVFGDDGRIYWHIGVMTTSTKDNALAGFFLIDTQTGKARYYKMEVGAGNSAKAEDAARSELGRLRMSGVVRDSIPQVIYGRFVYVMPVEGSANSLFQTLMIVDAENTAYIGSGQTKEEALESFREALTQGGNRQSFEESSSLKTGTFTILRVATTTEASRTVYLIRFVEQPEKTFRGFRDDKRADLPFAREKDRVLVGYSDSPGQDDEIVTFEIPVLHVRK